MESDLPESSEEELVELPEEDEPEVEAELFACSPEAAPSSAAPALPTAVTTSTSSNEEASAFGLTTMTF